MIGADRHDEGWFERLWQDHQSDVHMFSTAVLRAYGVRDPAELAADITQATFYTAWTKRHDVPDDGFDALTWLRHTARNHVRNQLRSSYRRHTHSIDSEFLDLDPRFSTGGGVDTVPERLALSAALARMATADRQLLILTYWQNLTPVEIAEIYGVTTEAVRKRQHRARQRLRQELAADYADGLAGRSLKQSS